jgi:hypothetical protein
VLEALAKIVKMSCCAEQCAVSVSVEGGSTGESAVVGRKREKQLATGSKGHGHMVYTVMYMYAGKADGGWAAVSLATRQQQASRSRASSLGLDCHRCCWQLVDAAACLSAALPAPRVCQRACAL